MLTSSDLQNCRDPTCVLVDAVVVHYRSRGLVGALVDSLEAQEGVDVRLHIIECGDDGTVGSLVAGRSIDHRRPGKNLGYSGGNNLLLANLSELGSLVLVVNPDVHLLGPHALRTLVDALEADPLLAATAPTIRTAKGKVEYTDSVVDLDRNLAIHTGTHLSNWPDGLPKVVEMTWIDGACILFRNEALKDVGIFDERFFLFSEEVDWCIRASSRGWKIAVCRESEVFHARSSAFAGSTKGAYYYWRNRYLLSFKYLGPGTWLTYWGRDLARFALSRTNRRSGLSAAALGGAKDALLSKWGCMAGDA